MKNKVNKILKQNILPVLAPQLRRILTNLADNKLTDLVEIRLRANKPLVLELTQDELFIDQHGLIKEDIRQAYQVTPSDITDTLNLMTASSLYTVEEELKAGYLTLPGGHRVGLVGQVIRESNQIKRIKHISGLNIRLCQEIIGAADEVIRQIIAGNDDIYNTLIISPPRCGKTTLIRDLTRQISNGVSELNFKGLKVGVVDERSEIGGAYQGVAQNRLGMRTDLLDRAPKAEGMMLLIRSMSPDLIVTDEIGSKEDIKAVWEALNAGVRVITTIHGNNLADIRSRLNLKELLREDVFKRIIILSGRAGPGTIEKIIKR
ncbi:stage III sporulation protein AA [Natroniella sulfidigena]|uniref:stage III sporulation protein AA n=1 Tax=Natroniella sulfidigena TaxID=723921 RepID=UPI00200A4696|nr:stage III sporulation protein AA [Natroniella sulfidigena]MCK8817498.1 stage III sporulation protein AA [Natroniella sulfidigena]